MNPLTKLREALAAYDDSLDNEALVPDRRLQMMLALRFALLSPEFAEAELMARARDAVVDQYKACSVVTTPNGSNAPKVVSFSLSNGDYGYLITVGSEWRS